MKKIFLLILSLLLALVLLPVKSLAEFDDKVELQVHTKQEAGAIIEGIEHLTFDVYDLTDWREVHGSDEKRDKEFILDTYSTKEELRLFVQEEGLIQCNQISYPVDEDGTASFSVPRFSKGRNATYLILANGETGKQQMLPIILYLPLVNLDTKEEADQLIVYGKYQEVGAKEPSVEGRYLPKKLPHAAVSEQGKAEKSLPSMNDLVGNGRLLGIFFIIIGFLGFTKNRKKKIRGKSI